MRAKSSSNGILMPLRRLPTTFSYSTRNPHTHILPHCCHHSGVYQLHPFLSPPPVIWRPSLHIRSVALCVSRRFRVRLRRLNSRRCPLVSSSFSVFLSYHHRNIRIGMGTTRQCRLS
ncbi:hypothetical protein GYMLUDRAFT_691259 [Collybiopsis luxurians FD-317 M1]|uniref:Uncharacterized protein n=1 Tax=Collybiopsis luxurians FD-317 M1 TaxID=944289 RepID=A0A0D0CJI1_9AGAR|nr:hypothetical protein GYMLUDRAFT_691259 [Collybiopsis luxurians FD-317 M1]